MSIKTRLEKLEQLQHTRLPTAGRVIVEAHEAGQAAARWLAENPGKPLPDLLVVREIMDPPTAALGSM
ncbi:hypothetical protein [Candidatus Methylomicrobium oryzae]|uniref:hypothetical protein n=1 Tax=Candidatus Methylomicrobium oryzae TaxID=2802053 RepID=UPI001920818A|nr:hypothetical protein [Methylomicrobium sp. RS1]MBL1264526.1 hypothetical protein [Methylomicrobium sp. RS1]